jgi:hypothetical protein
MSRLAGFCRRPSLAACLASAALAAALAGCSTAVETPKRAAQIEADELEGTKYIDPFGEKDFKEVETKLPPPPADANLIPFQVSTTGQLTFAVDSKSVVVGEDGAVRYAVVITSPTGARNVSYEGVRCDVFQRKLFATLPPGSKDWVRNRSDDRIGWQRMNTSVRNSYAATLAVDFLCEGRTPVRKADDIVRALRDNAPRGGIYR